MAEVAFTGNIRRLRLRPGDILAVEATGHMTSELADAVRAQLRERFPDNEIVIFAGGLRLHSVLRKDEA